MKRQREYNPRFAQECSLCLVTDRIAEDAPGDYRSINACSKLNILDTAVLDILLRNTRYVHINELLNDNTAKALLALDDIVSDDTVHRALRNAAKEKLDAYSRSTRTRCSRRVSRTATSSTSTIPSSRSTAIRMRPNSATIRSSPDDRATPLVLHRTRPHRARRGRETRQAAEKKVEAVDAKPRKTMVPSAKSRALVPTTPAVVKQAVFEFVKDLTGGDGTTRVTNDETLDTTALSQLYRDRKDCEKNFDEYKNQWGWAGFTTKKIKSYRAMARLIASVATWWNVYCPLADPSAHREAITYRLAFLRKSDNRLQKTVPGREALSTAIPLRKRIR